jgi:hypothetical protein
MEFLLPGYAYFTHGRPLSGFCVMIGALFFYLIAPPFGLLIHIAYLFDLPYLDRPRS